MDSKFMFLEANWFQDNHHDFKPTDPYVLFGPLSARLSSSGKYFNRKYFITNFQVWYFWHLFTFISVFQARDRFNCGSSC